MEGASVVMGQNAKYVKRILKNCASIIKNEKRWIHRMGMVKKNFAFKTICLHFSVKTGDMGIWTLGQSLLMVAVAFLNIL